MDSARDIDEIRAQLVELQTQLAFQEELLNQLNAALSRQQQDLTELKKQGELLRDQYRELQRLLPGGDEIEKPPHY